MTSHPLDSWALGADGVRERDAARVIIVDHAWNVLLLRGHDIDEPDRHWWFTVGGGIDAGESPEEAALREVVEETGLVLTREQLTGPVIQRSAVFDFAREACRQFEVFYLAIVAGTEVSRAGWTDLERELVDDIQWWALDDLLATDEIVYPAELATQIVALRAGWDGELVTLTEGP